MPQKTWNRSDINDEIRSAFGFVPTFYSAMPDATVGNMWWMQRDFEWSETALDNKTKELVGLAVAANARCRYSVYWHTQTAKAWGATDEEIREAVAMGGLTSSFSTSLWSNGHWGSDADFETFKREVDRSVEWIKKQDWSGKSTTTGRTAQAPIQAR